MKRVSKFSNGEDFNASAYVAHFKRYQSSKAWGFLRGMVGPIKEVVAKDNHTLEFRMLRPFQHLEQYSQIPYIQCGLMHHSILLKLAKALIVSR